MQVISRRDVLGIAGAAALAPFSARLFAKGFAPQPGNKYAPFTQHANEIAKIIADAHAKGGYHATHAKQLAIVRRSAASYGATIGLDGTVQDVVSQCVARNGRDGTIQLVVDPATVAKYTSQHGLKATDVASALSHLPKRDPVLRGHCLDAIVAGTQTLTGSLNGGALLLDRWADKNAGTPLVKPAAMRQDIDLCQLAELFATIEISAADWLAWFAELPGVEFLVDFLILDGISWELFAFVCTYLGGII